MKERNILNKESKSLLIGCLLFFNLSLYFTYHLPLKKLKIKNDEKQSYSLSLQRAKEAALNRSKNLQEDESSQGSAVRSYDSKGFSKDTTSLQQIKKEALNCAKNLWKEKLSQGPPIPLYDLKGFLVAYEITFSIHHPFPSRYEILSQVKEGRYLKKLGAFQSDESLFFEGSDKKWGKSEFKTLILSVREDFPPIPEYSNGLSRFYTVRDIAEQKAESILQKPVFLSKIYYAGFLDKYFEFTTEEEDKILIHCFKLKAYSPEEILSSRLHNPKKRINKEIKLMWKEVKKGRLFSSLRTSRIEDYFDRKIRREFIQKQSQYIDGVPFYDWSYGCAPTAAAMVLGYWDSQGYDRLVDYFFTRWDPRQEEYDTIPNVQEELAEAMNTNVGKTGNYPGEVAPGIEYVTNVINGYEFNSYNSCNKENGCWNYITREIDSGRPFVWGIVDFPEYRRSGHSVAAVGYSEDNQAKYVTVHNTWDTLEHAWSYISTPMGEDYNNIIRPVVTPGINSPPVLGIQRDEEIEVREGRQLKLYFTIWDPDDEPVDISISSPPPGSEIYQVSDPTPEDRTYPSGYDPWPSWPWEQGKRYKLAWTPDYTQAGKYIIRFELSDSESMHVENVEINVINYKKTKKRR